MRQTIYTILENTALTDSVFRLLLAGDTSAITAPGQFVNIALTGKFLRRPISVCDWDGESLTLSGGTGADPRGTGRGAGGAAPDRGGDE